MKVLHMLDALNKGGTETIALDFCQKAREFGIDLTFVAAGRGHLEDDFRNTGIDFLFRQRRLPVDLFLEARYVPMFGDYLFLG